MNKNTLRNVFAVIDIGSNVVRMQVSQVVKSKLHLLEELEYPVSLGHDVFYDQLIHYHSIFALTEILLKYQDCLSTYPIQKLRVVSCSAMRYAENQEIVQDIVKTQLNITIDVLEENEEKALLYFDAIKNIQENEIALGGNFLIAYIGTGSIGLAMFQDGKISYTENVPTGTLRMYELLGEMRRESETFYEVIDDYVDAFLAPFRSFLNQLDHIILLGPEIGMLARLTEAETMESVYMIDSSRLYEMHNVMKKMTIENIALQHDISEDEAAMLYHTLFICIGLMRISSEKHTIIAPDVDITKAAMRELTSSNYGKEFMKFKREGALSCLEKITRQWYSKCIDTKKLVDIACRLFDKLRHYHGMEADQKVILKAAAQFFSYTPHWSLQNASEAICSLMQNIELFGLSQEENDILVMVTGHMQFPGNMQDNISFKGLHADMKLPALKLTAIASIALALCKDDLQDIKITLHEKQREIIFHAKTETGALLGKWAFHQCETFFQNVFGVKPVLALKLKML